MIPPLTRIVSGGQTGADRAALDFAIRRGIPHGGWCPRERRAEDGALDPRYLLTETPGDQYVQRTEWNVRDADGTVVLTLGAEATGGSLETIRFAERLGRPWLHLARERDADAAARLAAFVRARGIRTLNVAGSRESKEPGLHAWVLGVLGGAVTDGAWLRAAIEDFTADSPDNTLGLPDGERVFDRPLVGFAAGDDPLWREYRRHIGAFYLTPADLIEAAHPGAGADAAALTVVSWVLPSTVATRREQAAAARRPSERWARTRHYGEIFNVALRRCVVELLAARGVEAVAPLLSPLWRRSDEGPYAPCSNWSERHAAYAAGLGTFGLCDGLITPVGKAHRTGSVVARLAFAPTPRPYADRHAYCLHFTRGTCGKCIPRCPVRALGADGHDKRVCMEYTERSMNRFLKDAYGIDNYACGLCQCGVPCADHVPTPEEG